MVVMILTLAAKLVEYIDIISIFFALSRRPLALPIDSRVFVFIFHLSPPFIFRLRPDLGNGLHRRSAHGEPANASPSSPDGRDCPKTERDRRTRDGSACPPTVEHIYEVGATDGGRGTTAECMPYAAVRARMFGHRAATSSDSAASASSDPSAVSTRGYLVFDGALTSRRAGARADRPAACYHRLGRSCRAPMLTFVFFYFSPCDRKAKLKRYQAKDESDPFSHTVVFIWPISYRDEIRPSTPTVLEAVGWRRVCL
ncbi:hypothetical protein EVAR_49000_1 [Eumeta japonica]|uniref:Uncharacterized protein n=1 Tax=Eumeta variegata TaxID=151549 RepID=A0A4C1Z240_EUMVA|nr:hypothetical protein EVAR_49000_1 [Eumeta japonica]